MSGYGAVAKNDKSPLVSEVQSHSCEWLRLSSEKRGCPPNPSLDLIQILPPTVDGSLTSKGATQHWRIGLPWRPRRRDPASGLKQKSGMMLAHARFLV